MTTIALTAAEHDSVRTAALKQAASNMRQAADHFALAAGDPDRVSLGDAANQAGIVRDDLTALDKLGYEPAC